MNVWKKLMVSTPVIGGLLVGGAALGPAVAAPPTPIDPNPTEFTYPCANGTELEVVVSGKEKTIVNASGVKAISPRLRATVTNVGSGESVTVAITGTLRPESIGEDDDPLNPGGTLVRVRATGNNILIRPDGTGLVRTSGNKTFIIAVDKEGDFVREVQGPEGPGKAVDLCEALA